VRRALVLAATAGTLLAAAPAHATLVYSKNTVSPRFKPSVWVAQNDGTAPRRLVTGRAPHLSPDGAQVLFAQTPSARDPDRTTLNVIPTAGGAPRTLLRRLNSIYDLEWSADSRHVLAVGGSTFGPFSLKLIDAATGASRTLAKGYFYGFGFSPDGQSVVYTRAPVEVLQIDSDLYTVPVAGGAPKRIPTRAPALAPVWGPQFIAYSLARLRKLDAPVFQIHRVNPDGTGDATITHTHVGRLVSGLSATAFSADGSHLVAQFGGQDTSYAVAVDPATGAERVLGPTNGRVLQATAISKDGSTVLAASGGLDESAPNADVVTIPWAGGKPTVLVRKAAEPDWDR
jgi:Tol biopolymer transport system component